MFKLREYQVEATHSIWNYFRDNYGNPVVVMPTGTGKSIIIAEFLRGVFQYFPDQNIMVLTHVKELIAQNYEKLLRSWPQAPAGIYSAGLKRKDLHAQITFAGIQSVRKKAHLFGTVHLVIIDEAHLVSAKQNTMYRQFINELKEANPLLKVIGLTATPYRLGHGLIIDNMTEKGVEYPSLFTDICFDISDIDSFNRLIAEGYLAPVVPKSTLFKLDIDGVHMRGGEFIPKELQLAVDRDDITERAILEAMMLGEDRNHWLVFCAGVDHAINTTAMLNHLGVPAVAVHSKMSTAERDAAIEGFKSGRYRAAVNNNVLTTGFDFPEIDLIAVLRPTASAVLWVQMLGRGTRPAPGKENCLVLDFANNTKRLGPINDPVVPKKKGEKAGEAPVKECPVCATWIHAGLKFCNGIKNDGSRCNHEFEFITKIKEEASTQELIAGSLPITKEFRVDFVTYNRHQKPDRPDTMRVTYHCGVMAYSEWISFEAEPWLRGKAKRWWALRTKNEPPKDTTEALHRAPTLPQPSHIRVWTNKPKYPEVMTYCFDGTCFGTLEPKDSVAPTRIEVEGRIHWNDDGFDDSDVPF